MNDAALQLPPAPLLQAYRQYLRELWLRRSRIGAWLTVAAIPTGWVLDRSLYRQDFHVFLLIRGGAELLVGLVLAALYRPAGKRWVKPLTFAWIALAFIHIGLMMAWRDGIHSPYYIGLVVVVMGTCLLVPWNVRECAAACLLVICVFFAGSALFSLRGAPPSANASGTSAIYNVFFILIFPGIGVVSCGVNEGYRFREFKLRYDLDQKKQELETSYAKLEELDKAKSHFFANISHELRTPLTLILSPLDELRRHSADKADIRTREALDLMFTNGLSLLNLINDLLDLVKLEEGRQAIPLAPVNLSEFIPGVVSAMRGAAERAELRLEIDVQQSPPLWIRGNKDRIEKILLNLVFNALKFTPAGGRVRARAWSEDSIAFIEVEDTGIGIAQEKLGAVFSRFWQEDSSSTRAKHGAGIGLALVKELVELHGGQISVRSQKGEGAAFTIRLPALDPARTDAAAEASESPAAPQEETWVADLYRKAQRAPLEPPPVAADAAWPASKSAFHHSLLVVEDDPAMQRFLQMELKDDYNVLIASDGLAGYALAQEHQPKLIVTDLMLPKLDGISLCRKLRASPTLRPTRIVLLTARMDDSAKLAGLKAGADDFLTKPFSTVELKTRLANLLLTVQLERELQHQNQLLESTLRQLRAAEAHLVQTERLSALGTLSAGIMHEINNPVNFMLTAVHFLRASFPEAPPDAKEAMDDIEGGLKRVRDIIADLKGFAYGGQSAPMKEVRAEKVLRVAKRLLSQELKDNIELREHVDDDLALVGNETQLAQLLVNLLQNSIHATAGNPAQKKPRQLEVRMVREEDHMRLTVRDNGMGIPKENLAKLYDPFFTTKPVGQGVGLGLSISHTIIRQHRGEVSVQSEVGQFTEFTVKLPLSLESPPDASDSAAASDRPHSAVRAA